MPNDPRRRRGSRGRYRGAIIAAIVLVLVGVGAWLWLRSRPGSEPAAAGRQAAAGSATSPGATADSAASLPPLAASDSLVRAWMEGLSSHPELAEWLATDSLVRRFVRAVVTVGLGRTPRSELAFLEPEGTFRVRGSGDSLVVDPASYRRYDPVAGTFAALDIGGAARIYRRLRPLFRQAYRDLGYREGSFDAEMARAVEELRAAPVPEGPVRLVPHGAREYDFADPRLEGLDPVQKQLLRMGPANVRRVQTTLGKLAEALDLPMVSSR